MIRRLQEPEPPGAGTKSGRAGSRHTSGVLLFAGEATDSMDSQQVHGAMRSGVRAAEHILARLGQQLQQQASAKEIDESG